MRFAILALLAALSAPVLIAGPAAAETRMTIAVPFGPTNAAPDPRARQNGWMSNRAGVSETLLGLDHEMRLVPRLATAWENLSPTEWRLTLREGVRFHDGTPMDAASVKASLEKIDVEGHPAHNPRLSRLLDIAAIETPDPMTVLFRTNAPNAAFPWSLTEPSAAVMREGTEALPLIGTGPFVFESAIADRRYDVRAFPDYWGGAPALDALRLDAIPEPATAALALASGDVDLVFDYPAPDFSRLAAEGGAQLFSAPTTRLFFLAVRAADGPTADPRVRRAISLAIDRATLVEIALDGVGGAPAAGVFPETMAAWRNAALDLPFDPEAARALLAEAGAVDSDGDGTLEMDGADLALRLRTYEGRAALKPTAELLQVMLDEAGFATEIAVAEYGANNEALRAGEIQLHLQAWGTAPQGDPGYFFETLLRSDAGLNDGGYASAELDRLLTAGRETFDAAERKAIYDRVQAIVAEDAPLIPLFHQTQLSVGNGRVVGYRIHPAETYLATPELGLAE